MLQGLSRGLLDAMRDRHAERAQQSLAEKLSDGGWRCLDAGTPAGAVTTGGAALQQGVVDTKSISIPIINILPSGVGGR